MPKEWYAFVSCGAPAESRALEVFFKSKNLQSRKIFDGISQIQDRTFSCNSDFDTLDYDYDYDSDLSPQSFPSSEFVSTTGKGLKRSLDSNCDLDSKFDLVPTSHIVLDVHDTVSFIFYIFILHYIVNLIRVVIQLAPILYY